MMLPVAVVEAAATADPVLDAARRARLEGRSEEAVEALRGLAAQRPGDADVWLNLGLAYSAAGRLREADEALSTALALAPTYREAQLASARVAWFRGDAALARTRLAPLLAAGDTEAQTLKTQIDNAQRETPSQGRIDLSYAESRLSRGLGRWTLASASLSRSSGSGASVALRAERTERFGDVDTYLEAGVSRASGSTELHAAFGGAPNADYRPEVAVSAGGLRSYSARGAWTIRAGADAAWSRFGVGDVRSVQPLLVLNRGGRFDLALRGVATLDERDELRTGYAVRAGWRPAPRLRLELGWADAPESSEGVTIPVTGLSASIQVDVGIANSLRADALHEDRGVYSRDEVSVSLAHRF